MAFLDLPPFKWNVDSDIGTNVASYPPLDPEVDARLRAFYAPQNRRLETFLGRKLNWTEPESKET